MTNLFIKVLILLCVSIVDGRENYREFPKCGDLNIYLAAMERATTFCSNIYTLIDTNLAYGIFISRVNIERSLQLVMPKTLRKRMRVLAGDMKWLNQKLPLNKGDPFNRVSVMTGLKRFSTHRYNLKNLLGKIEEVFPTMQQYEQRVLNLRASVPGPELSDSCINQVLNNQKSGNFSRCILHPSCKEALIFGDNFGYGLTHRVLLMMMMHQSRSCYAFSAKEDDSLIQRLCSYMYFESKFIIDNDGYLLDLVIENSVLCAQLSYDIFLNRQWIKRVLVLQSARGCFGKNMDNIRHDRSAQPCDQHLTAVTMAYLSVLIRYLVENCFAVHYLT